MRVSGIDQLRQRYSAEITVELEPNLDDGKPWAVRLKQLRPVMYLAARQNLPIPGDGSKSRRPQAEILSNYQGMRVLVASAIVAVREVVDEQEDGNWVERWTPVEVVSGLVPENANGSRVMHIDEFDLPMTQNVSKCWTALFQAVQNAGRFGDEAVSFREEGSLDAGAGVEIVRRKRPPARAGAGEIP